MDLNGTILCYYIRRFCHDSWLTTEMGPWSLGRKFRNLGPVLGVVKVGFHGLFRVSSLLRLGMSAKYWEKSRTLKVVITLEFVSWNINND